MKYGMNLNSIYVTQMFVEVQQEKAFNLPNFPANN